MTWHKWPEERPDKDGCYLCWVADEREHAETSYYRTDQSWQWPTDIVTHWAVIEPPEGIDEPR